MRFETTSPTDGALLRTVEAGGAEEVDRAAAAAVADAAFPALRDMGGRARKALLHKIADGMEARAEKIACLERLDTGQALRFMSKATLRGPETLRFSPIAPKGRGTGGACPRQR